MNENAPENAKSRQRATETAGTTIGGGDSVLYMFPRSDGILLGGTFERGASHLTADAATTERIVREHARISREMRV
jgi:hypothetical protein